MGVKFQTFTGPRGSDVPGKNDLPLASDILNVRSVKPTLVAILVGLVAIVLGCSAITWRFVEVPARRWLMTLVHRPAAERMVRAAP